MQQFGSHDARADRIREWLLLLLRFAITWDRKDEAAVFAMADEIDALGLQWRPSAPSFFRRTSSEVCKMITAFDDPRRATVLKKHIARIDDPRLRRAFQAAVDVEVNHRSCDRGVAARKSKGPQLALRPPDGKGGAGSPP
jgi:hypothetical protein